MLLDPSVLACGKERHVAKEFRVASQLEQEQSPTISDRQYGAIEPRCVLVCNHTIYRRHAELLLLLAGLRVPEFARVMDARLLRPSLRLLEREDRPCVLCADAGGRATPLVNNTLAHTLVCSTR